MPSSLDLFKNLLEDAKGADYYGKWLRDNCGKTHGGTPDSPAAGTPAAMWYTFRDRVLAGKAKPSDAPDMGGNSFGHMLVDAALMPLFTQDPSYAPSPAPVPTSKCLHGARIDGQFYVTYSTQGGYGATNATDAPWSYNIAGGSWDLYEAHVGKKISIVHWGGPGTALPGTTSGTQFPGSLAASAASRGARTLYSLAASLQQIQDLANNSNVNGTLSLVDAFANAVKAGNIPIYLRMLWEMNGNWTSQTTAWFWQSFQGTTDAMFIAAWRTLVNRIRAITNLCSFVWCPNVIYGGVNDPTPRWPGAAYVDRLGLDGYMQNTNSYDSPSTVFDPSLTLIRGLPGASAIPVLICETSANTPLSSPGKSGWFTDLLTSWGPKHPEVEAIVMFNQVDGTKMWPIEIGDSSSTFGGAAQTAFRNGIANGRYVAGDPSLIVAGQPFAYLNS